MKRFKRCVDIPTSSQTEYARTLGLFVIIWLSTHTGTMLVPVKIKILTVQNRNCDWITKHDSLIAYDSLVQLFLCPGGIPAILG